MKRTVLVFGCSLFVATLAPAQNTAAEAQIKALVPYSQMIREVPGLTLEQYNSVVRELAKNYTRQTAPALPSVPSTTPRYLGRLSQNPYAQDSTSNQYGSYGSPYSATSGP